MDGETLEAKVVSGRFLVLARLSLVSATSHGSALHARTDGNSGLLARGVGREGESLDMGKYSAWQGLRSPHEAQFATDTGRFNPRAY